jgi:hypothetical protein
MVGMLPLFLLASGGGSEPSVKLIHAEGRIFYRETFITWSTEYEKEPCEFLVEASPNGRDWTVRGRVKSHGGEAQIAEYQFVDSRDESLNHYRLRKLSASSGPNQVLANVSLENYSISVDLEEFEVNQEKKLVLCYTVDQDQELILRIYNKMGEQVVTHLMPFKWSGTFLYHLDISELKAGNYLLVVTQVLLDKSVAEKQFTVK